MKKTGHYNAAVDRNRNVIGKRLATARNALHWSQGELRDRLAACGLDIPRSTIGKWETGSVVPNAYQFIAACYVLGIEESPAHFCSASRFDLNPVGHQKVKAYREDLIATGKYSPVPLQKESVDFIEMPISNLPVSAGTGEFLADEDFEMMSFPVSSVPSNADFALRISGDSMEPVFQNGQVVWVQETTDLRLGEVGIFYLNGSGYIKTLGEREYPALTIGPMVKTPLLISYNKDYCPIAVGVSDDFRVIGRVLQ